MARRGCELAFRAGLVEKRGMQLSDDQKKTLGNWIAEGVSLGEIQKRLEGEFGMRMTYMDVRFLVDDLGLELKGKEKKEPAKDLNAANDEPETVGADEDWLGGVIVEIDRVNRPGAIVSGSVRFSDGVTAQWYVDSMGRLGLEPKDPTYQPPAEDIQEFQIQLQDALRKRGF